MFELLIATFDEILKLSLTIARYVHGLKMMKKFYNLVQQNADQEAIL